MVECQVRHIAYRHPASLVALLKTFHAAVDAYQCGVGYRHNALYLVMEIVETLQPDAVCGVAQTLRATECPELYHAYLLQSGKGLQNTLCGVVKVFIHIDEASW